MAPRRLRATAFTLIEVLVVVAIIALLISILLPSLSRAREQAKAATCASRLQQILRAETAYQTENKEWIPGSPLTTGYAWSKTNSTLWNPGLVVSGYPLPKFATDYYDWATPLRAISQNPGALRPASGSAAHVNAARARLLKLATGEPFHCPSNAEIATKAPSPLTTATDPPFIQAPSYLSMITIMRGGPAVVKDFPTATDYEVATLNNPSDEPVVPPMGYVPRHSRLGRESMKVFVADGTRFVDFSSPVVTYSSYTTGNKGMISAAPPAIYSPGNPSLHREYSTDISKRLSYRHGNKDRIQAAFFDGHVEGLSANLNGPRFVGTAVDPRWYYPTGSTVINKDLLHKEGVNNNLSLP